MEKIFLFSRKMLPAKVRKKLHCGKGKKAASRKSCSTNSLKFELYLSKRCAIFFKLVLMLLWTFDGHKKEFTFVSWQEDHREHLHKMVLRQKQLFLHEKQLSFGRASGNILLAHSEISVTLFHLRCLIIIHFTGITLNVFFKATLFA